MLFYFKNQLLILLKLVTPAYFTGAATSDFGSRVWRYYSGNQRIGDAFWSLKRYQQGHARQGLRTLLTEQSLHALCEVEYKSGNGLEVASKRRPSNCGLKALSKKTRKESLTYCGKSYL